MSERSAETHARIQREIAQEKAVTLGRAGERLEAALAMLAALAAAHAGTREDAARAHLAEEYDHAWRVAELARQTLLIPARGRRAAASSRCGRTVPTTGAPTPLRAAR